MTEPATTGDSIDTFLAEVAKISTTGAGAILPVFEPGFLLARRYELRRPVGRGAHGVVWAACDTLTGDDVAVKVLLTASQADAARVCAEVAALRNLRLHGVVRLVDDGMEQGSLFLVMPFIQGEPFPGRAVPTEWGEVEGPLAALLTIVGHVHAAGVVHRDLKPANVIVDELGRPTVLDFGLALAATFDGLLESGRVAGTPAYLAPEQASGETVGPSADLYAIGVMVYRALSGRFPHEAPDVRQLIAAKQSPALPLAEAAPSAPAHVARAVDALLATRPDARPATAQDALERFGLGGAPSIGGASLRADALRLPETITSESLRELFEGQDRLFWTREDAARVLHQRTGGDPARVRREIATWVRLGWCRFSTGAEPRLIVEDETIDRLEIGFDMASLRDPVAFCQRAVGEARRLAESGRLGHATALLQEALSALRRATDVPVDLGGRALSLWVEVAMAIGTPRALDHALYEICRMGSESRLVADLEALVRAALAVGAWTDRALELASALQPFADPALARLRNGVRVTAARRVSLEREVALIDELSAASAPDAPPETRAAYDSWLGRLRYRQGRFEEAARLHAKAADSSTWATSRVWSLVSQASALVEAFAFDDAAAVAARAVEVARASRHAYGRAHAEWVVRLIAYRRKAAMQPDLDFIEAASTLRVVEFEALVCLTEAAVAWRAGADDLAHRIATRATRAYASVGERGGGLLLTKALAVATAPSSATPADVEMLVRAASESDVPGIGVQVLGLLAPHTREPAPAETIDALVAQVDERHRHLRIDILSVEEALKRLSRYRSR